MAEKLKHVKFLLDKREKVSSASTPVKFVFISHSYSFIQGHEITWSFDFYAQNIHVISHIAVMRVQERYEELFERDGILFVRAKMEIH